MHKRSARGRVAFEHPESMYQLAVPHSFTVEETSWGPYITSVQGIKASNNDRTYWKLLSNGQPLSQGKEEDEERPCRVRCPERSRVSVRFGGTRQGYESILSLAVMSDSLWPHGLQSARLLCPWDLPGKNTWWRGSPFPSPRVWESQIHYLMI